MGLDKNLHLLTNADVRYIREIAREVFGESPRGVISPEEAVHISVRYRYFLLNEPITGLGDFSARPATADGSEVYNGANFKVTNWGKPPVATGLQPGFHGLCTRFQQKWIILLGGGGGGGGDSIRFRVVDVICTNGVLEYIKVQWTHYSGGCDIDPPGIDAYTGLINVYDTCILSYYTVDFLTSGQATGRATYFYSQGYCEGQWLVDSICGTPECS